MQSTMRRVCGSANCRRFGENKLLYPLDGKAVYRHLLDRLAQIAGRHENWELLVVTQYERILEELAPLVKAGRLQTVFSPDSEKGISYTIRAGIEAAEKQNADACACFAADQPYLKEETAERFLESMEMQKAPLGCVFCGGESGNPVWFSKPYKRTFRRLRRKKGAETALGIGNSVPGRSRVGIKGSGPERGSLMQRHRRLP